MRALIQQARALGAGSVFDISAQIENQKAALGLDEGLASFHVEDGAAKLLGQIRKGGAQRSGAASMAKVMGIKMPEIPLPGGGVFSVGHSSGSSSGSFDPAEFTFKREARIKEGKLAVFNPPSGDGGGSFEVAGITERFQPREARRLRGLIEQGRNDQAISEAKDFFRKRSAPFTKYAEQRGLQLQIADSVHHRGEGGLRRILQRATGSKSKSYQELIRELDSSPNALARFNRARVNYELQEIDRGRASRQKFRKGLINRFRSAHQAAIEANRIS